MTRLIKYKIIAFVAIWLFCSAASVFACGCVSVSSTEESIKQSSVVFSGKVVGFEYRKGIPNWLMDMDAKRTGKPIEYETLVVKVQVEKWWKGDVPTEIFLITDETKNADGTTSVSSCNYRFSKDESYLIFAGGKENEYRTNNCSRTQKMAEAEKDLKILGEGKEPIENKDDPKLQP